MTFACNYVQYNLMNLSFFLFFSFFFLGGGGLGLPSACIHSRMGNGNNSIIAIMMNMNHCIKGLNDCIKEVM